MSVCVLVFPFPTDLVFVKAAQRQAGMCPFCFFFWEGVIYAGQIFLTATWSSIVALYYNNSNQQKSILYGGQ